MTTTNDPYVPLEDAREERRFGGKAVQCGAAARAGLPVPQGFALAGDAAAHFSSPACDAALEHMLHALGGLVAVRSSAVGEDAADASFAGQHATVLGVRSVDGMRRKNDGRSENEIVWHLVDSIGALLGLEQEISD